MRVLRYLKEAKIAVLFIILFLLLQVFTDLSLPRFTALIVDVGIQQSGVEHTSPQEVRSLVFEEITMMVSDQDELVLKGAYDKNAQGNYEINERGKEEREQLDQIMAAPLVLVTRAGQEMGFSVDQVFQGYQSGQVTKEQIREGISQIETQIGGEQSAFLEQQAIQATIAEYKSLGIDLGKMQMDYLFGIGSIMLALAALGMFASILVAYLASKTAAKIGKNLRTKFFSQVVNFSDAEIHTFSAASLITRGTNDIQQIQTVSVFLLRLMLYAPMLAVGGIIMIAQTNTAMSWTIFLAVGIISLIMFILFKVAMPKFRSMQKLIDRVNLVSREILTGLSVIRAFGRQEHEEQRFGEASTRLMKNQLFVNRAMAFMMPLIMLVMNGVSVLIIWVGGSYIDQGAIQTGDLIAYITYSMVIIMSFLMLAMMAVMLPRADVAAQRINEVIDTPIQITDPKISQSVDASAKEGARIVFDGVSFAYPDAEAKVLTEVSFVAEAGKTTAFIGSTGSGKSTIVKLLERFYDVTDGSITLDGVDIRNIPQKELRSNLGYVPQKAFLFSGTISSNIAYSDPDMPIGQIERAAHIAQADDFIEAKEEKYDSPISQEGTNVSGGQRQRLAIARALASQARAFVFDDSFSALDFKTDAALRQAMNTTLKEKTVLIVAQRISTIMYADQIVVLDNGRVVGKGTHAELMKDCVTYKEIATSQLSDEELQGGGVA